MVDQAKLASDIKWMTATVETLRGKVDAIDRRLESGHYCDPDMRTKSAELELELSMLQQDLARMKKLVKSDVPRSPTDAPSLSELRKLFRQRRCGHSARFPKPK